MKTLKGIFFGLVVLGVGPTLLQCAENRQALDASAPLAATNNAETAWQQLQTALRPPPPPAEWRTNPPSERLIAEYEKRNGVLAGAAADKAKDFHTRFPGHSKADEAKKMELQLLSVAIKLGDTSRQPQLDAALTRRLNDPKVTEDEKFDIRAQQVVEMLESNVNDRPAQLARAEKAAKELQSQFPQRDEAAQLLLMIAQALVEDNQLESARNLAREVENKAQGDTKSESQALLRKVNRVGKPLQLKFKDLAGKEIDVKDYAGKVVLIDFWATWCGPCVAALPEVKETYAKFHAQGFEILGLSLDKERDALTKFVATEKMNWPQYFDGLGWENKFTQEFEITGIPTMWLVDKKGNLRDLSAHQSLSNKVHKLLIER
jgi:thiol-disulfide isomerase/thioredoxin